MKLLTAIVSVIAASVALASPAACVPGTEIVSGTFTTGAVLTSSLACTEYNATFENFGLTVVSGSGDWTLSLGPATGSTSVSGTLEFDFTEMGFEEVFPGEVLLSYGMSFGIGPYAGEELLLQTGPLTEVIEHVCAANCVTLAAQGDFGSDTVQLSPAPADSVLLDVTDGDRLYQTVFTPEPASFLLVGCGVLGIGLVGLVRRRARATRLTRGSTVPQANMRRTWYASLRRDAPIPPNSPQTGPVARHANDNSQRRGDGSPRWGG